jgi:probable rRNA maturation factor
MIRLNTAYRGKAYATDVLSFPTLNPFRSQGLLGELIICLPVLKAQARNLNHSREEELDVLLIHGLLHLLGLDHEKSLKQATLMAGWEAKILRTLSPSLHKKRLGLIHRANSGN